MSYMTSEQHEKCHAIIHRAITAAGARLSPIPCSDSLVIVPLQISMTIALGRIFGIELTENAAKAAVAAGTGTIVRRMLTQLSQALIFNRLNAATVTESLGWMLAEDFAKQSTRISDSLEVCDA